LHNAENTELQGSPSSRAESKDRGQGGYGSEAIILAGGLGTRLRSVVSDIPKCMAPVAGKPFLYYVISHLQKQGIDKFIFSLGYKYAMIEEWLNEEYPLMFSQVALEEEPMGTGGAIKLACSLATEKNVVVVNGDTLFSLDIKKLTSFHNMCGADCTLSLKPMKDFNRYGVVELNKDHSISSFKEKQHYETGLINAGVYALNVAKFMQEELPGKFSFENDYLEKYSSTRRMYGVVQDSYFIDIGIPEDYERAQGELAVGS
jgi:D-glycero-alpha-D-manno-heptose 1-phosphate guanylyltransferase